jgi:hypothetical protein
MFRVRWERRARDGLTTLWTQADSAQRQAITVASHVLDQRLQRHAHVEGESRSKGRRITFVAPLAAVFRIEPDGQTVSVLQVRMFRQRGH